MKTIRGLFLASFTLAWMSSAWANPTACPSAHLDKLCKDAKGKSEAFAKTCLCALGSMRKIVDEADCRKQASFAAFSGEHCDIYSGIKDNGYILVYRYDLISKTEQKKK